MLEILKIKKDINWIIEQIKCLIKKTTLEPTLSATAWSLNHSGPNADPYNLDCFVWFEDNIYKSLVNNNTFPPTDTASWTNLGAGHLLLEEPTDWNATSGRALLKNKPDLSEYELKANKQNNLTEDGTGKKYPTIDVLNAFGLQQVLERGSSATLPDDVNGLVVTINDTANSGIAAISGVDNGGGYGVLGKGGQVGVYGLSLGQAGVYGTGETGVYGTGTQIGIQGGSNLGLAGQFNIGASSTSNIVDFIKGVVLQAYITHNGVFKSNALLVNTIVDNGIDQVQVNGSMELKGTASNLRMWNDVDGFSNIRTTSEGLYAGIKVLVNLVEVFRVLPNDSGVPCIRMSLRPGQTALSNSIKFGTFSQIYSKNGGETTVIEGGGGVILNCFDNEFIVTGNNEGAYISGKLSYKSKSTKEAGATVVERFTASTNGNFGFYKTVPTVEVHIGKSAMVDENFTVLGKTTLPNLSVYANNTDALAGGLVAGDVYRTSTGVLMITF
jgi:hypothetical protein